MIVFAEYHPSLDICHTMTVVHRCIRTPNIVLSVLCTSVSIYDLPSWHDDVLQVQDRRVLYCITGVFKTLHTYMIRYSKFQAIHALPFTALRSYLVLWAWSSSFCQSVLNFLQFGANWISGLPICPYSLFCFIQMICF